jgi:hypothetical protein
MEKTRSKVYQMLFALSALFIANNTHGGTPITISFEQIEFNSGYILTLGDGNSNNTNLSEYFAFYLNSNRNSYVDLTISSNCTDPVTLIINANQSGSGLGNMCKVLYNYTISSGTPIELNFDGAVPSTINKYDYYWNWTITAIPCNTSAYDASTVTQTTHHCCYVLFDEPQSPMDEPWLEVLNYACSWAVGQVTDTCAVQKITEGIYYMADLDGDIDYDWPTGANYYSSGVDKRTFDLNNFISNIKLSNNVKVNCSDVANLFNIFVNSLGLNGYTKRIIKISPNKFTTNEIDPIGSPGWNTAYWSYHQFGWFSESVNDACIRVNYSSPFLPTNMDQSTYDYYLLYTDHTYDTTDTGITTLLSN